MHIPEEPPAIVEENRPPASWPSKGRIELQKLKIRYRPNSPLVLKGITCTFQEGARVGIVGRTGSGKSTLISALFRLVEPASGEILIDGLNICSMGGLKDLRMKLSIIPQEPTLFRGSIRTNLDPLNLYTGDEIWNALEKYANLRRQSVNYQISSNLLVSDEGENWSVALDSDNFSASAEFYSRETKSWSWMKPLHQLTLLQTRSCNGLSEKISRIARC